MTTSMTTTTTNSTTAKLLSFPLNAWYPAAWDHEITGKGILSRTIAGRPLALYRTQDGHPVALADACWHRLAPLSMGKLVGNDEVQCPYHGLRPRPDPRHAPDGRPRVGRGRAANFIAWR